MNNGYGGPPSGRPPPRGHREVLVLSSREDAWMLPDEPFLSEDMRPLRSSSLAEAETLCAERAPTLVFVPIVLGGEPTTGFMQKCLTRSPAPVVVVIAANDQINAAAEAMRAGAFDCLFKPFSQVRLTKTVREALRKAPGGSAAGGPSPTPSPPRPASGFALREPDPFQPVPGSAGAVPPPGPDSGAEAALIGRSSSFAEVRGLIEAVAGSSAPVMFSGPVGTGKSALARQLHRLSPRASGPFISVDCGALTPDRIFAELTGPEGAAAQATGGTLFLDEIFELPAEAQPRLLRLLEAGHAEAEDGAHAKVLDFRVLSGTSGDPWQLVEAGRLRHDLFYRLHVTPVPVPPLAEREGDAALIARIKLGEFAAAEAKVFSGFSDAAMQMISDYDWPGNLRELLNVIWNVVLTSPGPVVTPEDLPRHLHRAIAGGVSGDPVLPASALIGRTLAEIEREVIEATIAAEGGSVPRAAKVLDVSPSTIYRKREAWARTEA